MACVAYVLPSPQGHHLSSGTYPCPITCRSTLSDDAPPMSWWHIWHRWGGGVHAPQSMIQSNAGGGGVTPPLSSPIHFWERTRVQYTSFILDVVKVITSEIHFDLFWMLPKLCACRLNSSYYCLEKYLNFFNNY